MDEEDGIDQQEIIDEEELGLLQRMKDLKKRYRDSYEALRQKKSEVMYCQQAIDNAKSELVSLFEEWYNRTFETEDDTSSLNVNACNHPSIDENSWPYWCWIEHEKAGGN